MALTYLDNLSFPAARAAINDGLNLIDTWNAGATEPANYQAFTPWLDTSGTPTLKIRNAANSAWVNVLEYQGDDASFAPWLIDEDDMASNLATQVPSQQSVKAYVDTLKAYVDTLKAAKNKLINGGFAIDQRNSGSAQTITAAAAKAYTVDRWYAYCTGANVTGQQVAGSAQSQYRYRFTGAASNTAIQFGQRIEAANSYGLNGQTCTLSADLASTSITTVTWTAYYANTTDVFGTIASPTKTQIATGTFTINTSIARYSTQISVPNAATTGIEIVFSVGALLGSQTWTIGDVQFEKGTVATEFEEEDIAITLNKCLRRYEVMGWLVTALGSSGDYQNVGSMTVQKASVPQITSTYGSFAVLGRESFRQIADNPFSATTLTFSCEL